MPPINPPKPVLDFEEVAGERFRAVHAEDLFRGITTKRFLELAVWVEYIQHRYTWMNQ